MVKGQDNLPKSSEDKPRGFSSMKNIIIIIVAALLMIGGVGAIVAVNVTKPSSQSALTDIQIAERYLSEQNYEQAVIEFEKILEIEPMNVDAYLGLAEAYIGKGDTEKALETLRKGLEQTGDARIQARIDELTNPEEPVVSSSSSSSEHVYGSMGFVTVLGEEYDIATTTHLDLCFSNLQNEDLKQIAKLTNLTYLDLEGNEFSDITPLAGLTNLEFLRLDVNGISDITPLAGLTNLTDLFLGKNIISDITPLAGLTNLTSLGLYNNRISDITPLAGLTNLTYLWLWDNQISDITPLAWLTNLTQLELWDNQISNITPLAGLANLIELNLGNNQISDIKPFAGLTNLTTLWLESNQISEADEEWLKSQLPNCQIET